MVRSEQEKLGKRTPERAAQVTEETVKGFPQIKKRKRTPDFEDYARMIKLAFRKFSCF